jgi:hypothetical protein
MKKPLQLVPSHPPTDPDPPSTLAEPGRDLWRRLTAAYDFRDEGGKELLTQLCASTDRAESCRAQIDRDGELLVVKGGAFREHPLLRTELACRAFISRTIMRLGLNVEPIKPGPGRPGSWGK